MSNKLHEFNREAMISDLSSEMVKNGWPQEEAQKQATERIDSMGATKTLTGTCPLGQNNPMACIFCSYGHITECHYPHTCKEAECSHYQEEFEAEGYPPDKPTWKEFKRDLEQQ